jgi:hypothetical protein
MQSVAISMPLTEGKAEHIEQLVAHIHDRGEDRLKELGANAVRIWHQTEPHEALVIYFEAENLDEMFARRREAKHPMESAMERLFEEVTGHHQKTMHVSQSKLLLNWHRERGHATSAHPRHAHH